MTPVPEITNKTPSGALWISILFVVALLLAIPFVQWTNTDDPVPPGPDTDTVPYESPDYEEPPPPPPPKDKPIEDFKPDVQPPTITEIEIIMNPDLRGFGSGTAINLPTGDIPDPFVDIKDLTTQPKPIQQPSPIYPPDAKRSRISGEVVVQFLVTIEGLTRGVEILKSSNPG